MAPNVVGYKQDLPPPGGYRPITWARVPLKTLFSPYMLFGGGTLISIFGLSIYAFTFRKRKIEVLEANDVRLALEPLLMAERDREFLKQLRRNREEEEQLMKDVPGWKVGTWYGEPIYKTLKNDDWFDPIMEEYFAHTHAKHQNRRERLFMRQ